MAQVCSQCGKTFQPREGRAGTVCPACEADGAAPVRARITGMDIVIVMMVLALLAMLVWLFLRPEEPARGIVFGDLGRRAALSNSIASNAPGAPPGIAPEQGVGAGAGNPVGSANPGLSAPGGAPAGLGTVAGDSGTPGTRPGSSAAASSSPASSPSPSQTSPPPPTPPLTPNPPVAANTPATASASPRHSHLEPYIELPPPDPAHKESTAALVAADDAAAVPPALPRTAELLGNSNAPGPVFDPLAGSNVVFVLDNSLGMMTNHKSFYARQELVRALQSMYPARTFYVLLFHSGGYEGMPALGPVAATPENVRDMTNWLFTVGYRNGADPTKAMLRALGLSPAPDQVWLLSGDAFPDTVIDSIREANSAVNARINTVGFHSRDAEAQLRQIAYENRGVYRFVPPPNPPAP